ncbi:MAG: hypothetical protein AB7I25_00980 [Vicinamibacterales bacterium]
MATENIRLGSRLIEVERYNPGVTASGIRDFVNRDWAALRASKDAYWADRIRRLGPSEALRIADELRRQMLQRDSSWPDADARRDDIASHARLSALLRRAGSTRRG